MENRGCCVSIPASTKIVIAATVTVTLIVIRAFFVLYNCGKPSRFRSKLTNPLTTLIVLGSGGHTAEMLNLLAVLPKDRFEPRHYVAAATDDMSLRKAREFESSLDCHQASAKVVKNAQFMQIYRSREVGQSYVTSVWTTIVAIAHAFILMIKLRPQVILCNGPGTCVPLCIIALLFKVVGIRWSHIFYIESIARVKRLSLSGLLLYKLRIADQFYVQWPQLQEKYSRAQYVGCLM